MYFLTVLFFTTGIFTWYGV